MKIENIKADFCTQTPDGQRRMLIDIEGVDSKSLVKGMSDELFREVSDEVDQRNRSLIFKAELTPDLCEKLQQASEAFGLEGPDLLDVLCDAAMKFARVAA